MKCFYLYKKFILFFLIISLFSIPLNIFTQDYSIIYIHLGANAAPKYMFDSIKQSRLFNPKATIFVVCYKENINIINKELFKFNVNCIDSNSLPISNNHLEFLNKTKLSGFWQFTTERFFYVEQVIKKFNLQNVFHLENDNLLYVNLKNYLSIFINNYNGIAATFDNDKRCIAGFLYIKNIDSISQFNKYCASISQNGYNDMQTLSLFRNNFPDYINYLPIIPANYKDFYQLISINNDKTISESVYSNNFDSFNSIFDAAAIGQFLGGIDPIHKDSKSGFINESCIFNPSYFEYKWKLDKQNRKIPFIKFNNKYYRINSLHIHCKNLKKFIS